MRARGGIAVAVAAVLSTASILAERPAAAAAGAVRVVTVGAWDPQTTRLVADAIDQRDGRVLVLDGHGTLVAYSTGGVLQQQSATGAYSGAEAFLYSPAADAVFLLENASEVGVTGTIQELRASDLAPVATASLPNGWGALWAVLAGHRVVIGGMADNATDDMPGQVLTWDENDLDAAPVSTSVARDYLLTDTAAGTDSASTFFVDSNPLSQRSTVFAVQPDGHVATGPTLFEGSSIGIDHRGDRIVYVSGSGDDARDARADGSDGDPVDYSTPGGGATAFSFTDDDSWLVVGGAGGSGGGWRFYRPADADATAAVDLAPAAPDHAYIDFPGTMTVSGDGTMVAGVVADFDDRGGTQPLDVVLGPGPEAGGTPSGSGPTPSPTAPTAAPVSAPPVASASPAAPSAAASPPVASPERPAAGREPTAAAAAPACTEGPAVRRLLATKAGKALGRRRSLTPLARGGCELVLAHGRVYWSARTGAYTVSGALLAKLQKAGGVERVGLPVGPARIHGRRVTQRFLHLTLVTRS